MRLSWKHVTLDHPWTWCHCLISHLSLPKQLQPVSIVSPRHRGPFSHSPQNLAAQWARTSMDPDHLTVVLPVAAGTCLKGVNLCIVLETADDVARWLRSIASSKLFVGWDMLRDHVDIWQCVKTLYPFCSHQNSWDLWMFIPLKMVFS